MYDYYSNCIEARKEFSIQEILYEAAGSFANHLQLLKFYIK